MPQIPATLPPLCRFTPQKVRDETEMPLLLGNSEPSVTDFGTQRDTVGDAVLPARPCAPRAHG